MSGHSKWSTIKRAKGANDSKRALVFMKLSKKISIAVKEGNSPDPEHNFKLRLAIEKAKEVSMPNDNIQRAINKGAGKDGAVNLEEVVYEGYGPYGTAFIVEAVTDNKNRTVSNIKHLLEKSGGSLGAKGSVLWQFQDYGQIFIEAGKLANIDEVQLIAIDSGADDIETSDEGILITTKPDQFEDIKNSLEQNGITVTSAEVSRISQQPIVLTDEQKNIVEKLFEALDDNEDVTKVTTNAEI